MKKTSAFIFALLITLVFADIYLTMVYLQKPQYESIIVSRVIDGDTLESKDGRILRLINVNSPEKGQPNYELSKNYLSFIINKTLKIEYLGDDKYKRQLVRIYSEKYLNFELIELGLASKFLVQEEEKEIFASAEKKAIEKGAGIWEHSKYYGCFSTDIDKKNEFVEFVVFCPNISLKNWFVKDESRKIFVFPSISPPNFILYTGVGNNTKEKLFWSLKENVWNDDSDSLYLFDDKGAIAHYDSY